MAFSFVYLVFADLLRFDCVSISTALRSARGRTKKESRYKRLSNFQKHKQLFRRSAAAKIVCGVDIDTLGRILRRFVSMSRYWR
jgi:hypothetical protein